MYVFIYRNSIKTKNNQKHFLQVQFDARELTTQIIIIIISC
jgi:hypothetical protein